ncbi:S-layer homology domain-containing protein [Cohnella sp. GCM10027633]|uniref:S-layer homology domain-containing protein n=1 Tax=unclassified Cohnella TaxID=2636738 RepID=UPI0036415F6E
MLLSIACLFGASGFVLAKAPSDIENSWAKEAITSWMERGLVNGYADGSFKPDRTITRAEVVALINRAFGIKGGSSSAFTDVRSADWFYKDVVAAAAAGYLSGYKDGTFKPNAKVSRQELAVITAKLLKLPASESYKSFDDTKSSPDWSKGGIGAVIDAKVMSGFPDRTFRPLKLATRAEVISILDKALKLSGKVVATYDKAGTYGPAQGNEVIEGNVAITVPGVILRNVTIKGDLLLAAGIGEGEAYLQGVTVHGTTTVEGGGANSVHVENSVLAKVIVDKKTGTVRIVVEDGTTTVREIVLQSGAKLEYKGADGTGIRTVTLSEALPENSSVILVGTFDVVNILSPGTNVSVPEGSVQQMNVAPSASNTNVDLGKGANIVALILDAITKVAGEGQVDKATVNADGSELAKKPITIEIKDGVVATVGGEKVGSVPSIVVPTGPTAPPLTAEETAATAAVADAESTVAGLAGDGTDTQGAIDAAQSDYDAASDLVTALTSGTVKTSLTSRLNAAQAKIDDAQTDLNAVAAATASVTAVETAAAGLASDGTDEQDDIDAAQADYDTASDLVTELTSSTAKTALLTRLTVVQATIDDAQSDLDDVIAATAAIVAAETAAGGLAGDGTDSQGDIDTSQAKHDTASGLVTALPGSTAKTALAARLAPVQDLIDDAQAVVDTFATASASVVASETAADGLAGDGTDEQDDIDEAQGDLDTASDLVTVLTDGATKTALATRLTAVQGMIDEAQSNLDAVIAAADSVSAAETSADGLAGDGTDEQDDIDEARADYATASGFVTALPGSTAKAALTTRLTAVLATIDDAQSDLDDVTAATASVVAAEAAATGLAGDGSDAQASVDSAQEDHDTASDLVTALPASGLKTALAARLATVQGAIDAAQDVVDDVVAATASVVVAETTIAGLAGDGTDAQGDIDEAQVNLDAASALVTALPSSTAKTALAGRLADVLDAIDGAQNGADDVIDATASVAVAETTAGGLAGDGTDEQDDIDAAQADYATASGLVTALPGSAAKTTLAGRLTAVLAKIDDAQSDLDDVIAATASIVVAETTAGGLAGDGTDTQGDIDTAQAKHDTAFSLVAALPGSTEKTALAIRLTIVQATIDGAQSKLDDVIAATAPVVAAETAAAGLAGDGTDTESAIDTAQDAHDEASDLVTALTNSAAKTALAARLSAVQAAIDDAQTDLDDVIAATAAVVAAETSADGLLGDGSDAQSAVDTAQAKHDTASSLAAALPASATKTALQARLAAAESTIDDAQAVVDLVVAATAAVVGAETASGGLASDGTDEQDDIDAAQADHDDTSALMTALPGSTAKTALAGRLATVQASIDDAQSDLDDVIAATAAVATAETSASGLAGDGTDAQGAIDSVQGSHDTASGLVAALPGSTAKTALEARLATVQSTIDDAQSDLDAVIAATASVVTAEAAAAGLLRDGSDSQGAIDAAQVAKNTASGLTTALPGSTTKTALQGRLAAVQPNIDGAQDALDLVAAAAAKVTIAESTAGLLAGDGTDTQAAIDAAHVDRGNATVLVLTLPGSTAKTALEARLTAVRLTLEEAEANLTAVIAATASVADAEAGATALIGDGTDAQGVIDAAQAAQNTASGLVAALPGSTAKTDLEDRLTVAQALIDNAQGSLDIVVALAEALDDANARVQVQYTAASWTDLQAALALPDTTLSEKAAKGIALNAALDNLVLRVVTSIVITLYSGSNPFFLSSITGGFYHLTFGAAVKDQFGVDMTTEGITWSHVSPTPNDRLEDASFGGTRPNFYDFFIYENLTARTATITVTSVSTPSVLGTYVIDIRR